MLVEKVKQDGDGNKRFYSNTDPIESMEELLEELMEELLVR